MFEHLLLHLEEKVLCVLVFGGKLGELIAEGVVLVLQSGKLGG